MLTKCHVDKTAPLRPSLASRKCQTRVSILEFLPWTNTRAYFATESVTIKSYITLTEMTLFDNSPGLKYFNIRKTQNAPAYLTESSLLQDKPNVHEYLPETNALAYFSKTLATTNNILQLCHMRFFLTIGEAKNA